MGAQLKKGSMGFGEQHLTMGKKYKGQQSAGLERATEPNTQLET